MHGQIYLVEVTDGSGEGVVVTSMALPKEASMLLYLIKMKQRKNMYWYFKY